MHALSLSTPEACSAFAQTCRAARVYCEAPTLWRLLHRARWDEPRVASSPHAESSPVSSDDYTTAVKARTLATIRLRRQRDKGDRIDADELAAIARTLIDAADQRPLGTGHSLNQEWLADLLRGSPEDTNGNEAILRLSLGGGPSLSPAARHLRSASIAIPSLLEPVRSMEDDDGDTTFVKTRAAELVSHLHALSMPSPLALTSPSVRTRAKEIVYTRGNWTRLSHYGPFRSDGSGRVDWRKVEALAIVAGANIRDASPMGWGDPPAAQGFGATAPATWSSTRGSAAQEPPEIAAAVAPTGWTATRPLSAGPVCADSSNRDWSGLTSHELVGSYFFIHYPTYMAFQSQSRVPIVLGDEDEAVGDCLPMIFELLPEGEWPNEIDQPDLSFEARDEDEEDDEDNVDYESAESDRPSSSSEDDDFVPTEDDETVQAELLEFLQRVERARRNLTDEIDATAGPAQTGASGSLELGGLLSASSPVRERQDLPSLRFRPKSGQVQDPARPKLAFRGVPGRLAYAGDDGKIPAETVEMNRLYNPHGRSFRGTIEWIPEDQVAKVTFVVRYGSEDQWVL